MRGGQSRSGDWQAHNRLQSDARYGRNETIASRDKLAQLDRDDQFDGYFSPFKIYTFPSVWRAAPNPATDWLKFRVHAGRYQGVIVAGTDTHDEDPTAAGYTGDFPALDFALGENDVVDLILPAGTQQYWFWIDATNAAAPVLKSGAVAQAINGNQGDPKALGWTSFPTPDAQHIPIGWVDTLTGQADKNPFVRQYVSTDLFQGGGGGSLQILYYLSSLGDFWICSQNPNGTGQQFQVQKPSELRNSIVGETIYGQSFAYSYPHNNANDPLFGIYRISTRQSDGFVEYQGVDPQPQRGYEIKAQAGSDGTLKDVSSAGRAWMAFNDQTYGH